LWCLLLPYFHQLIVDLNLGDHKLIVDLNLCVSLLKFLDCIIVLFNCRDEVICNPLPDMEEAPPQWI
jgi:hypothetical protein